MSVLGRHDLPEIPAEIRELAMRWPENEVVPEAKNAVLPEADKWKTLS
jgi:hypothetical protein